MPAAAFFFLNRPWNVYLALQHMVMLERRATTGPKLELHATLAMNRGDLAEAGRALEGALAYAPDRMSLKLALVRLLEKQERSAEAEALLEELLREDPLNPVLVGELKTFRAGDSRTPAP